MQRALWIPMDLVRRVQSNMVGSDSSLDFLHQILTVSLVLFSAVVKYFTVVALLLLPLTVNNVAFSYHC